MTRRQHLSHKNALWAKVSYNFWRADCVIKRLAAAMKIVKNYLNDFDVIFENVLFMSKVISIIKR